MVSPTASKTCKFERRGFGGWLLGWPPKPSRCYGGKKKRLARKVASYNINNVERVCLVLEDTQSFSSLLERPSPTRELAQARKAHRFSGGAERLVVVYAFQTVASSHKLPRAAARLPGQRHACLPACLSARLNSGCSSHDGDYVTSEMDGSREEPRSLGCRLTAALPV